MSHTPKHNGQERRIPADPRELAEEIERTRADVGDTVESLAARGHLRDQARQRAGDVADRARERIGGRSAALRQAGGQVRDRLSERTGGRSDRIGELLPDRAQQRAQDASRQVAGTLRRNRRQAACTVAALLAARWLIRRRRGRRAARARDE